MELNIDKMRIGSDPDMIKKLEESMASMQDKLRVLREARQKAWEKLSFVTFARKLLKFAGDAIKFSRVKAARASSLFTETY